MYFSNRSGFVYANVGPSSPPQSRTNKITRFSRKKSINSSKFCRYRQNLNHCRLKGVPPLPNPNKFGAIAESLFHTSTPNSPHHTCKVPPARSIRLSARCQRRQAACYIAKINQLWSIYFSRGFYAFKIVFPSRCIYRPCI